MKKFLIFLLIFIIMLSSITISFATITMDEHDKIMPFLGLWRFNDNNAYGTIVNLLNIGYESNDNENSRYIAQYITSIPTIISDPVGSEMITSTEKFELTYDSSNDVVYLISEDKPYDVSYRIQMVDGKIQFIFTDYANVSMIFDKIE